MNNSLWTRCFFVIVTFLYAGSFVSAEEEQLLDTKSLINPAVPSMNNGIPYLPLPAAGDSTYGPIVDNGENLEVKGDKVPISGPKDIKKLPMYQPLFDKQDDEIKRFCLNNHDMVRQNYFIMQTKKLQLLKIDIDKRIEILDKKTAEYKQWFAKREEFINKAKASLVSILEKMDPEEAALRLDKIDDLSAASLLLKLKPRVASAIMSALPVEKASYLAQIIIDAQKVPYKHVRANANIESTDIPQPVE